MSLNPAWEVWWRTSCCSGLSAVVESINSLKSMHPNDGVNDETLLDVGENQTGAVMDGTSL